MEGGVILKKDFDSLIQELSEIDSEIKKLQPIINEKMSKKQNEVKAKLDNELLNFKRQLQVKMDQELNKYFRSLDEGKKFIELTEKYKSIHLELFGVVPNVVLNPITISRLIKKIKKWGVI